VQEGSRNQAHQLWLLAEAGVATTGLGLTRAGAATVVLFFLAFDA
jgi:hypothetical protein